MQRRNKAIVLSLIIGCLFAAVPMSVTTVSAQTFMCSQDLNNNGDVAKQGETALCESTGQGQLCPIGRTDCASGTDPQQPTCPLGPQYPCMANNNTYSCSPNACVDTSTLPPVTNTADLTGYTDNGAVDPNSGSCLGQMYFFSGKGSECRPAGVNTGLFDCCSKGDGGLLGFLKYCRQAEADTIDALDARRCHPVGDYCVTKSPLLGCVQRAYVYCCFNSMLGRIIQEQGRPQLKKFQSNGNWGVPTAPNCIGLKPEEFQMLDFSKMDLSEYTNTINNNVSNQIQQKMNDKVNTFFNNTR